MVPTLLLMERIMVLAGADTLTINAVDRPLLRLAKEAFTPGPGLVLGDLTEANFDGYLSRGLIAGASPESTDPATGDVLLDLQPDPNGRYETAGTTQLPQTIYGAYLTNEDGDVLYCAGRFSDSITLTAPNQSFFIPRETLRLLNNGIL